MDGATNWRDGWHNNADESTGKEAFGMVVAAVTLGGSALSFLATACVLACFLLYNKSQRSLRHALVFNLTLAGKCIYPSMAFSCLSPLTVGVCLTDSH
jgi:hypothetical protein